MEEHISHQTSISSGSTKASSVSSDLKMSAMQRLSAFKFVKSGRKRATNGSVEVAVPPKRHLPSTEGPIGDGIVDECFDDVVMDVPRPVGGDLSSKEDMVSTLHRPHSILSTGNTNLKDSHNLSADLDSHGKSSSAEFQVSGINERGATPVFRLPPGIGPSHHSKLRDSSVVTPSRQVGPKTFGLSSNILTSTAPSNATSDFARPSRLSSGLTTPTRLISDAQSSRTAEFAKPSRSSSDLSTPTRVVTSAPSNRTADFGCEASPLRHTVTTSSQFESTTKQTTSNHFSDRVKKLTPFDTPSISRSSTGQSGPPLTRSLNKQHFPSMNSSLSTSVDSLSTPLQSVSRSLYGQSTTSFSTPISGPSSVVSSSIPLRHKLTPSIATPLNRHSSRAGLTTPINKQPTPLICTPSAEPNSDVVDIVRTPVPLAQRKFPGPAGLLPPLVRVAGCSGIPSVL